MQTIGLGGSCHWCTEGVFSMVKGVLNLEQGWISSQSPNEAWSEAIRVDIDPLQIDLFSLVAIHLHSHSCTSEHSLRQKYRSAVYYTEKEQKDEISYLIEDLQRDFDRPIITEVLHLTQFKLNQEEYLGYYHKDPERPFCKAYISPKVKAVIARFPNLMDTEKTAPMAL